jgi:hypothetical protein
MKKVCQEVRNNFALYEQLLLGSKLTEGGDIYVVHDKPSRPDWKEERRAVEQLAQPGYPSMLHTEVKSKEHPRFKFLLFASTFMSTPLANYDALGATHRNKYANVPLGEQSITTPHFNRYDELGHRIVYKTPPLTNPESLRELAQATHCVILFYDEFNIRHSPADYPAVLMDVPAQQSLFPQPVTDDPLAYVARF